MSPSILQQYKKRKTGSSEKKPRRQSCEDCLYFNPFGIFCEFHIKLNEFWNPCDEFEDRKKELQTTKTLGELPK